MPFLNRMNVSIPTPLRSYTGEHREVDANGSTLAELMHDLDRRYPGIRFRMIDEQDAIRPHIRIWVNQEQKMSLDVRVSPGDEVVIAQALSGG